MSFVDKVEVLAIAGDGGDGKMSFRHEKFIDKGGPDGGDGGNGGNIILVASRNQNTLANFRYQKEIKAESGNPGGKSNKHGRSGRDLLVAVPVGTVASSEDGRILADLTLDGQTQVVAHGGKGGFGNAHFVSSRRQTPRFAEKGEPGDSFAMIMELKMIADVGLVGLPNAGKSTLLARLSNARPEIADYPFTTLTPNLGVVDIDENNAILLADIPGLIEGAAHGKGLGHDFLRHIERTAVILHLIDSYNNDVASTYRTVRKELEAYQALLIDRPEIVVLTKIEGLDDEIVNDLLAQLKQVVPKGTPLIAISAQSGQHLNELRYMLLDAVKESRRQAEIAIEEEEGGIPVLRIENVSAQWSVIPEGKGYRVSGPKIEQFARRTDMANDEGLTRLRMIMQRMGIMHELVRQGIEAGSPILIGDQQFPY